jgi:hypothetical protein
MSQKNKGHVPMRTCIACRAVKPKQELVRLISSTEGSIEIDTTGKKPGRGAYLCPNDECWRRGVKRLSHALATRSKKR